MKIKSIDLLDLLQVAVQYAQLTGFNFGDEKAEARKRDFEARYRGSRLLADVKRERVAVWEEYEKILNEYCLPENPLKPNTRPFILEKKEEGRAAIKAWEQAELEVTLHQIEHSDMEHPSVTGEWMEVFERCGVIRKG